MIDLNNAWCKTTQENYDALIKFGYKSSSNITNAFRKDFETHLRIEDDTIVWGHKNCIGAMGNPDYWSKDREIHLVNGEFKYVVTKPKNNFKDYGFEADFEGEILRQINAYYVGFVVIGGHIYGISWDINGESFNANDKNYNLKPIKKEWYVNPDNFPCLCVDTYDNPIIIFSQEEYKKCPRIRPATKEEILTLLIKED